MCVDGVLSFCLLDVSFLTLKPSTRSAQVTVDRPDVAGRIEILKVHSRGKSLSKDVDLDKIARRTPGFTGEGRPLSCGPCFRLGLGLEVCWLPLAVAEDIWLFAWCVAAPDSSPVGLLLHPGRPYRASWPTH